MSSITDKLEYSLETKELIKQSIIDKGVEVSDEDTLRSYANKISEIQSGGSTSIEYGDEEVFNEWSKIAQDGEIFVRIDDNNEGTGGSNIASDILYNNSLTQLDATNVQDAIDKVFQSVSDGKILIADAITDKGIETSATDTFITMAENISQIESGGGGDVSYRILNNPSKTYTASGTFAPWEKYGNISDIELSDDAKIITCNFSGNFDLRIPTYFAQGALSSTVSTQVEIYRNNVLEQSLTMPIDFTILEVKDFVINKGDKIKIGKTNDGRGYLYLISLEFMTK